MMKTFTFTPEIMNNNTIRIGTRGSELALWQANHTANALKNAGFSCIIIPISTKGDEITDLSFDKIEGKGFFTKEIEDALLRDEIDLAVHSMKDLPTESHPDLSVAGISTRENPADWLLLHKDSYDGGADLKMKQGITVGTSSARRKAQLLHYRPDVTPVDIRGNVPTRLKKLRDGMVDGIFLAAAGLIRLELKLDDLMVVKLHPREFVPAPAQGVLAFQIRKNDLVTKKAVHVLHDTHCLLSVSIERKILKAMEGGCHMPLGVYCEFDANENYHVWAAVADQWNGKLRQVQISRSTNYLLVEDVVKQLKDLT